MTCSAPTTRVSGWPLKTRSDAVQGASFRRRGSRHGAVRRRHARRFQPGIGLLLQSSFAEAGNLLKCPIRRPRRSRSGRAPPVVFAWTAVHHAFTGPKPEFEDTFDTDPGSALAYAYDIVCNGSELGGGSIRIHREDVQKRVFEVMGISDEVADEQFGFLLDAFKFGAPPHGGIALGMDRVLQHLSKTESIRDVIAFPKSGGGFDPLTSAPAPITAAQRKEAGVDFVPED
ncbi:hypothetical protein HA402_013491 [Bradysia odoriphaga]|nr:hypothetical protein HA402_013491 [Bradysia odoriphaga]